MTLRIGILGASRVASYALIAPAHEVDGVVVAAVAARDPARAKAYAADNGIARTFDSYEALVTAPDIDAVYVALPPSLHARWSIAALEAGKPVLCEKPFALSLTDVDAMLATEERTGRLLMEAQHSHYHPLAARMREVAGQLGRVIHVDARFDVPVADTGTELRYIRDVGGGGLWDLGVYPAHWLRRVLGEEPQVTCATQVRHSGGADIATDAELTTASGATARLRSDMRGPPVASLRVEGTEGSLEITNPIAPQRGSRFIVTRGGLAVEEHFTTRSTYAYQLEAFRDAVTHGTPVATRGADTRATIALLTAIDEAART